MALSRKVAIITGASTGIGRAIALELSSKDVYVILIARSTDRLEKTLGLVNKNGGDGEIHTIDLSKKEEINAFILKVSQDRVNYLVNVAGVWHENGKVHSGIDYSEYSVKEIENTMNVGILAPMILANGIISKMVKGDKIINISGTFEDGAKGWLPYYVSKKAIEEFTVGLADELKDKGILVNCVSPSDTATESYKKYFPEYANPESSLTPKDVALIVSELLLEKGEGATGEILVLKK